MRDASQDDLAGAAPTGGSAGDQQVAIIGGGFYGCCIALHLRGKGCRVTLLERADDLLCRASYFNQARIHNGYHYPRSLQTGLSCVANLPRFMADFTEAVYTDFEVLYAVAKVNSKVTANQFSGFCERIGAPIRPASAPRKRLFNTTLVEEVFEVREPAFDAGRLREILRQRLQQAGVRVQCGVEVDRVQPSAGGERLEVVLAGQAPLPADAVYSCAYSQTNALLHASGLPLLPLKHELAELALVEPAPALADCGITVMDGPFFSTMPFPAERLHSFSHVRYTPRASFIDSQAFQDPSKLARDTTLATQFPLMMRDAARYVPALEKTRYVRSFYETKTVLLQNEQNDGRPIMCRKNYGLDGFHIVHGGKIDNIYDILQFVSDPQPAQRL